MGKIIGKPILVDTIMSPFPKGGFEKSQPAPLTGANFRPKKKDPRKIKPLFSSLATALTLSFAACCLLVRVLRARTSRACPCPRHASPLRRAPEPRPPARPPARHIRPAQAGLQLLPCAAPLCAIFRARALCAPARPRAFFAPACRTLAPAVRRSLCAPRLPSLHRVERARQILRACSLHLRPLVHALCARPPHCFGCVRPLCPGP